MSAKASANQAAAPPPGSSPWLVANADDFGDSAAANAAIIAAHREGIVTSASLMVTGPAFEDAVDLARSSPGLRVGLHLVLIGGRACLLPDRIPDLVDRDGRFPADPVTAGARWWARRSARDQLRAEVEAQVDRFIKTGLPLDHLNSHLHFHVHPTVFPLVLEVAEAVGVRRVRLPAEPWFSLRIDWSDPGRKLAYAVIFGLFGRLYRPRLVERGFLVLDGVFGLYQTGRLTEGYLERLLGILPPGRFELYAHPRFDTPAGRTEFEALTSPKVRAVVVRRGINLTTFSELAEQLSGR